MEATQNKFIKQVLTDNVKRFKKNHNSAIEHFFYKGSRGQTGNLRTARTFGVLNNKLTFSYPIYLRFLDMRKSRNSRGKRRLTYSVYNNFVYGVYSSIYTDLGIGFTDVVRKEIKEQWGKI